jgi:hypothetical protein
VTAESASVELDDLIFRMSDAADAGATAGHPRCAAERRLIRTADRFHVGRLIGTRRGRRRRYRNEECRHTARECEEKSVDWKHLLSFQTPGACDGTSTRAIPRIWGLHPGRRGLWLCHGERAGAISLPREARSPERLQPRLRVASARSDRIPPTHDRLRSLVLTAWRSRNALAV